MFLRNSVLRQRSNLLIRGIEEFWSPGGRPTNAGKMMSSQVCIRLLLRVIRKGVGSERAKEKVV